VDLADDFFPYFGAVADVLHVRFVEHQARGFQLLVVAGYAVFIEQRTLTGRRRI